MPVQIDTYGFNKVAAEDLTTEEWREELRKLREGEYPSTRSTPVPRSGDREEKENVIHRLIEDMDDEKLDKYLQSMTGEFPDSEHELMDPKEIEETYRGVSEEEIEDRTAPSKQVQESEEEKRDPSWIEKGEPGTFNPLGASIINNLKKIASELDKKGFYDEASVIDDILREF